MFNRAVGIRLYSGMMKQGKYTGKITSKIMECRSSSQVIALIKRLRKEEANRFGSFEISCAIKRFAQFKDYRGCFTLFNDVKNQEPKLLDQSLYSFMIKLCLDQYGHNISTDSSNLQKKRIKGLQSSKKLFFEMQHQFNIEPNEYVMTALISNCSKVITKKSLRMAEHHWNQMMSNYYQYVKVNQTVWNAMITVYVTHFKLQKAMDLLQEMNNNLIPDETTYLLMINGFRLNCKDLISNHSLNNSNDYIRKNQEENLITKDEMVKFTKQTFKDCIIKHGPPNIMIFGCVIHNFAALGDIDTCLSLLYFMMKQQQNQLCNKDICNDLGLNEIQDIESMIFPNIVCYNLCLKAILFHTQLLLNETMNDEYPAENQYLDWKFIEKCILNPMKNLEISKELFITYKVLIQICEIKMEYMIAKISYIAANIKLDQDIQNEYLCKQYQVDILEIFDKLKEFFEDMIITHQFKPNQQMFDLMYKMGFKFTKLYSDNPALFDNLESDPLLSFNEWLVRQLKLHGLK